MCVCVSARVFWHGEVVSCQSHKSGPHCSFRWIITCVHTQIHTSFDPFHTCKKWTFWCYSKKCFLQMWKKSACNAQQTCRLCCQVQCTPFISSKQSAVLHVGRDPELNKWMVQMGSHNKLYCWHNHQQYWHWKLIREESFEFSLFGFASVSDLNIFFCIFFEIIKF